MRGLDAVGVGRDRRGADAEGDPVRLGRGVGVFLDKDVVVVFAQEANDFRPGVCVSGMKYAVVLGGRGVDFVGELLAQVDELAVARPRAC
jgi:hypothetical protein